MSKKRNSKSLTTYKNAKDIPYFKPTVIQIEVPIKGELVKRNVTISIDNIYLKFHCRYCYLDDLKRYLDSTSNEDVEKTYVKGKSIETFRIVQNNGIFTIGVGYTHQDGIVDETLVSVTVNPNKCFNGDINDLKFLKSLGLFAIDGFELQKFDIAFDVQFERKLTHFGFQGTKRVPYWEHDTEYLGGRDYHINDIYSKIYEKAPGIVRIEITVWNKDENGNILRHGLKPVTIAKKIIKKMPVIYFSSLSDIKSMAKENHEKERFYRQHRSVIEACRANANPCQVLRETYLSDELKVEKKFRRKNETTGETEIVTELVDNTYGNDTKKRNRIIDILKGYGLTQFVITDEDALVESLSFYSDLMDMLNEKNEENESDVEIEITDEEKNEFTRELEDDDLIPEEVMIDNYPYDSDGINPPPNLDTYEDYLESLTDDLYSFGSTSIGGHVLGWSEIVEGIHPFMQEGDYKTYLDIQAKLTDEDVNIFIEREEEKIKNQKILPLIPNTEKGIEVAGVIEKHGIHTVGDALNKLYEYFPEGNFSTCNVVDCIGVLAHFLELYEPLNEKDFLDFEKEP